MTFGTYMVVKVERYSNRRKSGNNIRSSCGPEKTEGFPETEAKLSVLYFSNCKSALLENGFTLMGMGPEIYAVFIPKLYHSGHLFALKMLKERKVSSLCSESVLTSKKETCSKGAKSAAVVKS